VVSKYIKGTDLGSRIGPDRFSHGEAARLVSTVAAALHYAHTQGVVHRDVKPANILLSEDGTPCVVDFGLALRDFAHDDGPRYAGTPAYMSPEQARGEGHRVDGRTDIYSLGAVFYELLTGRRVFTATSHLELIDLAASQEPRPPRQIDDRIPTELERICLKALSKRVSDRYTTAKDMAEDLDDYFEKSSRGFAGTPTREGTWNRLENAVRPDSDKLLCLRVVGTPYIYRSPPGTTSFSVGRQRRKSGESDETGNDFVIRVPGSDQKSLKISRRHFEILRTGDEYSIVDRSKMGVELNGVRLRRDEPYRIQSGNEIRIAGVVTLEVLVQSESLAEPVASSVDVCPSDGSSRRKISLEATVGDLVTADSDD
jgi:serine/threonine protein kinase